jgi:hypothetical protein
MRTITVTIGRNVGPDPLPAEEWNTFVFETRQIVEAVTTELWASGPSRSTWDGVSEENFYFYGPLNTASRVRFRRFRNRLETLATKYRQEAIGISIGTFELVEPFPTAAPAHSPSDAEIFVAEHGRLPRHAQELNDTLAKHRS